MADNWHTAELFGEPYPAETPQRQEDWQAAAPGGVPWPDMDPAMWYRINGEDAQLATLPFKGAKPIYVHQGSAYAEDNHPGLVEWAGDSNLRFAEYPGGGQFEDTLKRPEDYEMFNRGNPKYAPEPDNPDAEPRGPFACSQCDYKPTSIADYRMHVEYNHNPHEEEVQDGHFPQIDDFDEPLPLRRTQPKPNSGETVAGVNKASPYVIRLPNDKPCYSIPQFETYSKIAGFDTPSTVYYGAYDDGELVGYGVVREAAAPSEVMYHVAPVNTLVETEGLRPANPGWEADQGEGVHLWPSIEDAQRWVQTPRDEMWSQPEAHPEGPLGIWEVNVQGLPLEDDPYTPPAYVHRGPIGPERLRRISGHEYESEVMMIQAREHGKGVGTAIMRRIKRDYGRFYTHANTRAGERLAAREGMVNVSGYLWRYADGKDPKDMLEAAVPFVFDIGHDRLTLGYPGYSTHDVTHPQGFTPGGIVEGTYEPGGKVTVWSATTQPWSARHLLDLWKAQAPQMEVTSLEAKELDGSLTKLADDDPVERWVGQGQVLPYAQHDPATQKAIYQYMAVDGEAWDPGMTPEQYIQKYGQEPFGITHVPAQELLGAFNAHHEHGPDWLKSYGEFSNRPDIQRVDREEGRGVPAGSTETWPVILDRNYGDVLEDGWHRVYHYLTHGVDPIPAVYYPYEGDRLSAKTAGMETQSIGPYMNALVQSSPAAANAYDALSAAGGKVYVVGGAVRDYMQGKTPKDVDMMVGGLQPEEVLHVLRQLARQKGGGVKLTGQNFGVYRYWSDAQGSDEVEIAIPRTDEYRGGSRAKADIHVDPDLPVEDDLARRDFTANAMAVGLDDGKLYDPFNGAHDLQRGVLRTTYPRSFQDDPSRLVRALIAHGRFGLVPDEKTRLQMRQHAHMLGHESPDTLQKVLRKWMESPNPAQGVRLAHDTGLLEHLFPQVEEDWDFDQRNPHHNLPLGQHQVHTLDNMSRLTTDPNARLAALLHDGGKRESQWIDENGVGHYYQTTDKLTGETKGDYHERVGAHKATAWLNRRYNWPRQETQFVHELVRRHMFPPFSDDVGARKFLNKHGEYADELLNLRESDQEGKGQTPEEVSQHTSANQMRQLIEQQREMGAPVQQAALAINGNTLLQMGLKPGPAVGQVLQSLTNAVVENPELNTPEQLQGLAQQQIDALPLETRATA